MTALDDYRELVKKWNERVNLTGPKDGPALDGILFTDAEIVHRKAWLPADALVVDVGAGVGAPTIPLLLLRADVRGILLEPRKKRAEFLRAAVAELGLRDRCEVREDRIDPRRPRIADRLDVALSRATFGPAEWLRIGRALAPRTIVLSIAGDLPAGAIDREQYRVEGSAKLREAGLYDRR
jgi:16S rRNA (guanine527-N7)-methyltransferase